MVPQELAPHRGPIVTSQFPGQVGPSRALHIPDPQPISRSIVVELEPGTDVGSDVAVSCPVSAVGRPRWTGGAASDRLPAMSWRERLSTLFVSNPIPEDPDEPVEIGVLPIAKGPVAVTLLIEAGFDAVGHDAFNIVTNVSSGFRILVPRRQSEHAARFLDELLTS